MDAETVLRIRSRFKSLIMIKDVLKIHVGKIIAWWPPKWNNLGAE